MECFDKALAYLQEAVDAHREVSKLYPDMYKPHLALTLGNMGAILRSEKINLLDDAKAKYDESLEIYEEFFRRYPPAYMHIITYLYLEMRWKCIGNWDYKIK